MQEPGGRSVPSVSSYLGLITPYLMEYTMDWANEYACIKPEQLRNLWNEALAQGTN